MEYLATYRSDGAHRYLDQLRHALDRCGATSGPDGQWTVLATGVAGDESLLLRLRQHIDYGGPTIKDTFLAVIRVGDALVVLADTGWEASGGDEVVVRQLMAAAVHRASTVG
jgi:hypothetical protein